MVEVFRRWVTIFKPEDKAAGQRYAKIAQDRGTFCGLRDTANGLEVMEGAWLVLEDDSAAFAGTEMI